MSENEKNTVILSGGGTGGHIYPAIAVARELQKQNPELNILFVGALGKMEMEKVPEAGYKIIGLPIAGIQRSLTPRNLLFPFKLLSSYLKAKKIIKSSTPLCVIGFGGYASGPIMLAAQKKDIPTVLQEQNSFAGITNKRLARKARAICVAYDGMEKVFPASKIKLTGNPVRSNILDLSGKRSEALRHFGLSENKTTILTIGGSLGALSINESLKNGFEDISGNPGIQLLWQTGKHFYPQTQGLNAENIKIKEFIKHMDLAYAAADIIISRAGALSISELCLVGKPVILVPFPYAAEDHQTHNAKNLVNKNAAIMINDSDARKTLLNELFKLERDKAKQQQMSQNIATLGKPDAAKDIVKEILKAIGKN